MESLFRSKDVDGNGTLDISEFTSLVGDCPRLLERFEDIVRRLLSYATDPDTRVAHTPRALRHCSLRSVQHSCAVHAPTIARLRSTASGPYPASCLMRWNSAMIRLNTSCLFLQVRASEKNKQRHNKRGGQFTFPALNLYSSTAHAFGAVAVTHRPSLADLRSDEEHERILAAWRRGTHLAAAA